MNKELFLSQPLPASFLWHIFGKDRRSLCGKYALLLVNKENCEDFIGNEKYTKGQDCKACFRKAGLIKPLKTKI